MQVELTGGATGRVSGYADQLVRAWGAGRKAETLKYGTSGVVTSFGTSPMALAEAAGFAPRRSAGCSRRR